MNRLGRRPPSVVLIMRGFSIKLQKEELRSSSDRQVVPGSPPISPVRKPGQFKGPTPPRGGNVGLGNDSDEKTLAWRSTLAAPPLRVTSM